MHGQARKPGVLHCRFANRRDASGGPCISSHGLLPSTSDPNREGKSTPRKRLLFIYSTHHLLTRTEQELLLQLQQVEPVLRTARLEIDLGKKLAYKRDNLWYVLFVGALFGCLFQHGLKEQRVARKTSRRFCQIRVEFELARVRPPLRILSQPTGHST